ncbi:MAG: tRNA lysidine(34) synthetase TilS [Bacteroidales bacterium]
MPQINRAQTSMLERLKKYIETNKLLDKGDKILLAVSGGADSMAMLHLFSCLEYDFAVAHCNFQLRGLESDRDQRLVMEVAERKGIEIFTKQFDTQVYAQNKGISIEMAARELRYGWFEAVCKVKGFNKIATAHHREDRIETVLINMMRGTGLKGLIALSCRNGNIIRPILFANKPEIIEYIRDKEIPFIVDSSNLDTKIIRNHIRKNIIPLFSEINTAYEQNFINTIEVLEESYKIFQSQVQHIEDSCVLLKKDGTEISIEPLIEAGNTKTYLFELLSPYGVNPSMAGDIANALTGEPGKIFITPTHKILKDRNHLIIQKIQDSKEEIIYIGKDDTEINTPIVLSLEVINVDNDYRISRDECTADIDYDKLQFPLLLRHPNTGDYFHPLGLKGNKKLSDFMTDIKLSRFKKEKVWLLCNGEQIVWVLGLRLDNRYRITSQTKKILRIKYTTP